MPKFDKAQETYTTRGVMFVPGPEQDRCSGCAFERRSENAHCNEVACGRSERLDGKAVIWIPKEKTPVANIPHEPAAKGAAVKFDGGKPSWSLLMRGCAKGLLLVVGVLDFGAKKYAADSWQRVENARERYKDALYRHLSAIEQRGFLARDPETGMLEWAHVACNALFLATFAALDTEGKP